MAVVKKTKASDLQAHCKKLVTLLKKHYKAGSHKSDRDVLRTMLYAVCLENATQEQADAAYEILESSYHDWNEIRVSTYTELNPCFEGMSDPDARSARVRAILQYVFEINFDFDFEPLRRKTLELAEKQLQKIRFATSFIQLYTLQHSLGTHMVPVDDAMRDAAVWLGLANPGCSTAEASDGLKSAVSKSDAPLFCQLMRGLATDARLHSAFAKHKPPPEGHDLDEMVSRLEDLLAEAAKGVKAKPKAASATKPIEKAASKKVAPKAKPKAVVAKKKPR